MNDAYCTGIFKAKSKKGHEVLIDQRQPEFATHVNLRAVGGAPVLEFYYMDVRPMDESEEDELEFDLEEGMLEPIAQIALSPTALDQLEELIEGLHHECGPECEHD